MRAGRALKVAMLAALGCGGSSGDVPSSSETVAGAAGVLVHEDAGNGAAAPPASFTEVYEMLFPMTTNARCVACHSMPPNDIANGNLQMGADKASAYTALVGKTSASSRCMNQMLVMAGAPDQSLLLRKLTATPPCGSRMPLGGNALTDAQLAIVRSWIAGGAKDD